MTVSVTHAQVTVTTSSPNPAMMTLAMGRPPSPGNSSGSDKDEIGNVSSTTALRRLHFKSGRNARPKAASAAAAVPKVVVMGSSTASTSEATINTSTDSASTLITSVTVTDTSENCDSLDMVGMTSTVNKHSRALSKTSRVYRDLEGVVPVAVREVQGDISGQSEPLLSSLDEPLQTAISIESDQSITEMELTTVLSRPDMTLLDHLEEDAESSLSTQPHKIPRTAPISSSVHFPFDPPSSPKSVRITEKNQSLFTFKEAAAFLEQQKQNNEHHVDKQEMKQFPQLQNSFRQKDNIHDKKFHWSEEDDKENKKRKEPQNKFSSLKDDVVNTIEGSGNDKGYDDIKKQKKDLRLKSRTNRYINNIKTSPKKEKFVSNGNKINSAPAVTCKDKFYSSKKHSMGHNKKDLTMFPFDREAIDYERIQRECFAVEVDPKFPYHVESDSSTDSDENEPSVYDRKSYHSPAKGTKNDIFQQYTLLAQQETFHSYEKRQSKRNRPDLIHTKYDHIAKSDAFSPKPISDKPATKAVTELHKFDQIASKFEQIAPKFDHVLPPKFESSQPKLPDYYHFHQQGSNLNLPNNIGASQILSSGGGGVGGATNNSGNVGSRGTPPLPDLRVDFFAESMMHRQLPAAEPTHDVLDDCQKPSQNAGAINVTPNPMETAVCTQPRATIVVQQPSLSLDNTVETLLLKNEGDFVSVEQAKESRKKKQQREENMRQLLDVTNTLTFEELRDFEMRYGSPHHSRSQSVKTPGSRASGRPNQLSLPQQRSRVASMPNTGVEEEYYRLRHFSITGKGVVNRGDSLKSRRSRSNNSVASSNSSTEHLTANVVVVPVVGSAKTSATCSLASSRESSTSNPGSGPYRVLMLGSSAVGKSSLVSQFMTSEYLHAYDTSIDDESGEKSVSVLLSGEESELVFIDHAYSEMSPENCLSSYEPHGYCVIYSSADRSSFLVAERILQTLWTTENIAQKAVILVGNKADLARSRVITSDEGKAMATAYDCKFIETSVGINHNVDELLVGLLSQIRLKLENPEKSRDLFRKRSSRKSKRRACSPLGVAATACLTGSSGTNPSTPVGPPNNLITDISTPAGSAHSSPRKYRGSRTSTSLKVKGLLGRVWARDSKSKSCENLHVL